MTKSFKSLITNFFQLTRYYAFNSVPKLHVHFDNKKDQSCFTIVFLHGIASDSRAWAETIKDIKSNSELKGLRLISLDLLGFGKSAHPKWLNYSYRDYQKSLNSTFKKIKVNSPIILVGHSMGGLISANFSLKYPQNIQQLILVSPPVILPQELAHLPDKFYRKTYGSADSIVSSFPVKTLANFIDKISSFNSKYIKRPAFSATMDNIILNRENYNYFSKIEIPTTIIHGRFDPLVIGSNLTKLTEENSHLKLINVVSHHDITASKRRKIIKILKEAIKSHETI